MTATRTPGITIGIDGRFFVDKRYRGIRIGMRVGATSLEQAEYRLQARMQDIDFDFARRAHPRPTFADCAARYLAQWREKRSFEAIQVHVRALLPHIGHLEPHQVHDATYKSSRDHVVILNDAAWSIVQAQRGLHPVWVFPYKGRRIGTMNNNGWQKARREAGLRYVRVHD